MDKKVVRIPIGWKQRLRNRVGDRHVPCNVTKRWLEFPEASGRCGGEEWLIINVMTLDSADRSRKLCELVIAREDLLHALAHVKQPTNA